jgi:hypothetical protein
MELLVGHAEHAGVRLPASLRLIFMSGDWIPRSLPERIRAVSDCSELRIVSMGGATEAAIWSNMYELCAEAPLEAAWKSIPYGRPLRNQTMLVLDEQLEHCEPWVTGSIHIGGVGVALGYYGDAERTAKQFVTHPTSGEWLFRTGDLGRLRPDGNLEILGREDSQVKVNGFRVELGEIEELLVADASVEAAAASASGGQLVAYVVLAPGSAAEQELSRLRALCAEKLPSYMVPRHVVVLDAVPLSSNGKVDRSRLPAVDAAAAANRTDDEPLEPPADAAEEAVRDAMAKILGVPAESLCCRRTHFFRQGGDSLTALRLLLAVRTALVSVRTVGARDALLALSEYVLGAQQEVADALSDLQWRQQQKLRELCDAALDGGTDRCVELAQARPSDPT